jgi:hypothetical protein
MDKIMNRIYPFLSISVIEIGTLFQNANNIVSVLIFLIQVLIGVLTIVKLYKEIKIRKSIKTEIDIENEIKKENRFLVYLLEFFKNFKFK